MFGLFRHFIEDPPNIDDLKKRFNVNIDTKEIYSYFDRLTKSIGMFVILLFVLYTIRHIFIRSRLVDILMFITLAFYLVNENNGSIWVQALYDVYSNLCYHVNTTNLNTKIKQMNYNYHAYSRILLREIDLRGPNIKNILKN